MIMTLTNHQLNFVSRAGFLNSIWLVQRTDVSDETSKIIARFYGGNSSSPLKKKGIFDNGFGLELETLVSLAASDIGIGPKVYFTSENYRIEQFIESRNSTFEDYANTDIVRNLARNLARFHSMIDRPEFMPFRSKKVDLFAHARSNFTTYKNYWSKSCKVARDKFGYTGDEDDILDELNLMEKISTKLTLKDALVNWDLNTMNILIRNEVTRPDQLRTVIIDYEFAHCNVRCFDVGCIAARMSLKNLVFGKKFYYKREEIIPELDFFQQVFLTAYHEEYLKHCKTCDPNGIDSFDNFLIESLYGACFSWIYFYSVRTFFLFSMMSDEEKALDLLARGINASFAFHQCAKERLFTLAPHLKPID